MYFSKGVRVWMEGVVVKSLEAFYTEATGKGYLTGDAEMVLDSGRVTCDTLYFDENREELWFVGRVHWVDSTREVFVDRAQERADTVYASGNLRLLLPEQRIEITGGTAVYAVQQAWAKVWGTPHMTLLREDTVEITADTFHLQRKQVFATGPIRVIGQNLLGHSEAAWILEQEIQLLNQATVIWDRGSLTGDTLILKELSDSTYLVIAKNQSRLTTQEDKNTLDLKAQQIALKFVNDSLETVRALRIQEGLYEERKDTKSNPQSS